jgi:tetratricopeptide (TPR) repeat protein
MGRGDIEGFREGLPFFQRAVALEPSFAQAWANLAADYYALAFFELAPAAEVVPLSRDAANEALRLDDHQAAAYGALGAIALHFDWDWEAAKREFERALELDPTNWFTRHGYADYLLVSGDCEGSVEQMLLGRQYDPMGVWSHVTTVAHLSMCGQGERAVDEGRRMVRLFPQQPTAHNVLGNALWFLGRYEDAFAAYRIAWGEDSESLRVMEAGFAEGGPQAAKLARANLRVSASLSSNVNPLDVAADFAEAGDLDRAFEWLERALQQRTPQLLHLRFLPAFDALRADGRYPELAARIGFPD